MNRRNCGSVITEMLSKIPKTKENVGLIEALDWNREDSRFKAPEEYIQWVRTQNTLIEYIPKPKEDWEFEILSIFTTQPVEDIKIAVQKEEESKTD